MQATSVHVWLKCAILLVHIFLQFLSTIYIVGIFVKSVFSLISEYIICTNSHRKQKKKWSARPHMFAIIFHEMMVGNIYYVPVLEKVSSKLPCAYKSIVLALAPMKEEQFLNATEYFEYLQFFKCFWYAFRKCFRKRWWRMYHQSLDFAQSWSNVHQIS